MSRGSILSCMLQRLNPPLIEELQPGDGTWNHSQLLEMDRCFVQACETAFQAGFESRTAASTTIQIGRRNGREAVIERALESAWDWLVREKGNVAATEIVKFISAQVPGIGVERIRSEFDRRFRQRGAEWV